MENNPTGINQLPSRSTWRRPNESVARRNMLTPDAPLERKESVNSGNHPDETNQLPLRPAWRQNAVSVTRRNKQDPVPPWVPEVGKGQEKNLQARAQVTDVPCKTQGTSEPPCVSHGSLAGASPHAPDPPRRERKKRRSTAKKNFTIRMSDDIRAKLEAKAAAAESYPSAYVLKLVAADLCLPIDEEQTARSRGLQEQLAALTVALNKQGGLFNQIAAALNRGQPCPVTRPEIEAAWRWHMEAVNAIIKLEFD